MAEGVEVVVAGEVEVMDMEHRRAVEVELKLVKEFERKVREQRQN